MTRFPEKRKIFFTASLPVTYKIKRGKKINDTEIEGKYDGFLGYIQICIVKMILNVIFIYTHTLTLWMET